MNKYFCSLPWVHLRLDSSDHGQTGVSPCCKFNADEWERLNPDNHVKHGIKHAMNHKSFKQIRSDMLNGIPTKGCIDCYADDNVHGYSMRTAANDSYNITNEKLNQEF